MAQCLRTVRFMSLSTATWANGALTILVLSFASSTACAQSVAEQLPDDTTQRIPTQSERSRAASSTEKRTVWYGAPIVIADLAAVTLTVAGAATASSSSDLGFGLIAAGVGTYVLGGPIVHFSEDRIGTGFASLGLRVGAPLLGGAVGLGIGSAAVNGCTGEMCGLGALAFAALGVGAGLLAAPIVDSAVLARKPVTRSQMSLSVTPTYQPTTGETGLSVRGMW